MRIISAALTARSSQLPVPIEDSTYYDAVRVSDDGSGVPAANANLFSVLAPYLHDRSLVDENGLARFDHLCRRSPDNKNSCERDVGHLLYRLVRMTRPARVIEVGVYRGAASCFIAEALTMIGAPAEYHLVDLSQAFLDVTRDQLRSFGLADGLAFHCGDAPELASAGRLPAADLVYLDADRSDAAAARHVQAFWSLVKPCGLLILHDSILWNGARRHANQLAGRFPDAVSTLATSGGSGITIARKDSDLGSF